MEHRKKGSGSKPCNLDRVVSFFSSSKEGKTNNFSYMLLIILWLFLAGFGIHFLSGDGITGYAVYEPGQEISEVIAFEQRVIPVGSVLQITINGKTQTKDVGLLFKQTPEEVLYEGGTLFGWNTSFRFNVSVLQQTADPADTHVQAVLVYDDTVLAEKTTTLTIIEEPEQQEQSEQLEQPELVEGIGFDEPVVGDIGFEDLPDIEPIAEEINNTVEENISVPEPSGDFLLPKDNVSSLFDNESLEDSLEMIIEEEFTIAEFGCFQDDAGCGGTCGATPAYKDAENFSCFLTANCDGGACGASSSSSGSSSSGSPSSGSSGGGDGDTCGTLTSSQTLQLNASLNTSGTCYSIGAADITIDCLGIYSITYGEGGDPATKAIDATGTSPNLTIQNCLIIEGQSASTKDAIDLGSNSNSTILNNTIIMNGTSSNAIKIDNSFGLNPAYNNTIENNTINASDGGTAIELVGLNLTIVRGNTIYTQGSSETSYGIVVDKSNYLNLSDNTIIANRSEQFYINRTNKSKIRNNTLTARQNNSYAIFLRQSRNNTVQSNIINAVGGNATLIFLEDADNNTIIDNVMHTWANFSPGVYLNVSNNATLLDNIINSTGDRSGGVVIRGSNKSTVKGNKINSTHDKTFGVNIEQFSRDALVEDNDINLSIGGFNDAAGVLVNFSNVTNITGNRINVSGGMNIIGLDLRGSVSHNVSGNTVNCWGSSCRTIVLIGVSNSTFFENSFTVNDGSGKGLVLQSVTHENIFLNNNFTAGGVSTIEDFTGNTYINRLIYNNSFGDLRWVNDTDSGFLKDLSLTGGIGLGINLTIASEVVSLNTPSFSNTKINSSGNISIYGLGIYESFNGIYKDTGYETTKAGVIAGGSDCNGTTCTQLSLSGGILIFNTTGFSGFAPNGVEPDLAPPNVTKPHPTTGQNKEVDSNVNISAIITDNRVISSAYANITRPNITNNFTVNLSATGDNYSKDITIHNTTGFYNITFFAKDDSGNVNSSIMTNFTVVDTTNPVYVKTAPAAGGNIEAGTPPLLSLNVTEVTNLSVFYANITRPNISNVYQLNLSAGSTPGTGRNASASYSPTYFVLGLHNVTFFTNDTTGNPVTAAAAENTTFIIVDTTVPAIGYVTPPAQRSVEVNSSFGVSQNITEIVNVSIAYANFSRPNISNVYQLNLSQGETGGVGNPNLKNWTSTYTVLNVPGIHNITFFANDTSGNVASTVVLNFTNYTAVDTTAPAMSFRSPAAQSSKASNSSIGVSLNVTEIVNISIAYANISKPNVSQVYQLNMSIGQSTPATKNMSATYTIPAENIGLFNITFFANDTKGNIMSTTLNFTNITVTDSTPPTVVTRGLSPQSTKEGNASIPIHIDISDAGNASAYFNVSIPNSSGFTLQALSDAGASNYTANLPLPAESLGLFNVTFFVNDTFGNVITSTSLNFTNFTVVDTTPPTVVSRGLTPQTTREVNASVPINLDISDAGNATVYANVTRPGTSAVHRLNLTPVASNYSINYLIHRTLGIFNVTFFANDTPGNVISTTTLNFTNMTVQDSTNPTINSRGPVPGLTVEPNASINVTWNLTEIMNVSVAYVNVTRPGVGVGENVTLVLGNFSPERRNLTNQSYRAHVTPGLHNLTIYANDTSGNLITYGTTLNFTSFTVADTVAPVVNKRSPSPQNTVEVNASVTVGLNMTELVNISIAYANISSPESAIENVTLSFTKLTPERRNVSDSSFTAPVKLGVINVTFYANDTSGNLMSSATLNFTNFTTVDTTAPAVTVRGPLAITVEPNASVNFTWNMTELMNISVGYMNVTQPGNKIQNTTLVLGNLTPERRNITNNTFLAPVTLGVHNVTLYANDTSGNKFSSTTLNFTNYTVADTTSPSINSRGPVPGLTVEPNASINVTWNLTEIVNVSVAYVNVTRPGVFVGENVTLVLGNSSPERRNMTNQSYRAHVTPGLHNLTVYANDTSGNLITYGTTLNFTSFTVVDTVAPVIVKRSPSPQNTLEVNGSVIVGLNLTELVNISVAYANISRPEVAVENVTLSFTKLTPERRNVSDSTFTTPISLGVINVTFYANDTSGNLMSSNTLNFTNFTTVDTTAPAVVVRGPLAITVEPNASVNFTWNMTELINISVGYMNITQPGDKVENVSLVLGNLSPERRNITNNTLLVSTIIGVHNVTLYANDTSDNKFSSTTLNFSNFTVVDTVAPTINSRTPTPQQTFEVNASVNLSMNLTEIVNISIAYANFSRPNTTAIENVSLSLVTITPERRNVSDSSFNVPRSLGLVNITFYANDTSGNKLSSATLNFTNFSVVDTTSPTVNTVIPAAQANNEVNASLTLGLNLSELTNVSLAYANISRPNISNIYQVNLSLVKQSPERRNMSSSGFLVHRTLGNYNVTFFANDTSGNILSTTTQNFTNFSAVDTTSPVITFRAPSPQQTQEANVTVNVSVNMTEMTNISAAYINVSRPNITTPYRLNLTLGESTPAVRNMSAMYRVHRTLGLYNVTFFANDTSGNSVSSTTLNFTNLTAQDTIKPLTVSVINHRSSLPPNETIDVGINITEVVNVSSALANLTMPNASLRPFNLSLAEQEKFNASFSPGLTRGEYNLTFFANDTSSNKNQTTSVMFNITLCSPFTQNFTFDDGVNATGSCMILETDNVEIDCRGRQLRGSGSGVGINVSSANNIRIVDCKISNFADGVRVGVSNGTQIINSTITGNSNSDVFFNSSGNVSVSGGTVDVYNATEVSVEVNNITHGSVDFSGAGNITNVNMSREIVFSRNQVFVNVSAAPELNVSANVTFVNNDFDNPVIYVDTDNDGNFTRCTNCSRVPGSPDNEPSFSVPHFSSYRIFDGPGDASPKGGSTGRRTIRSSQGGGGGGGGGGGPAGPVQPQQTTQEKTTTSPASVPRPKGFIDGLFDKLLNKEDQTKIKEKLIGGIVGNVVKDMAPVAIQIPSKIKLDNPLTWILPLLLPFLLVITLFSVPTPQRTFVDEASLKEMVQEGSLPRTTVYVAASTQEQFTDKKHVHKKLQVSQLNKDEFFTAQALARQHGVSLELSLLLFAAHKYPRAKLITKESIPQLLLERYQDIKVQAPISKKEKSAFFTNVKNNLDHRRENLVKIMQAVTQFKTIVAQKPRVLLEELSATRKQQKLIKHIKHGRLHHVPTQFLVQRLTQKGWEKQNIINTMQKLDYNLQQLFSYIKVSKFKGLTNKIITGRLQEKGWKQHEIQYALSLFDQRVQRVLDYLRKAKLNKVPEKTIFARLQKQGWDKQEIEEDLSLVEESTLCLMHYIKQAKQKGIRDKEIEQALVSTGWKKEEIEKEFAVLQKSDHALFNYIRSAQEKDIPYDVLKDRLLQQGWDPGAIEKACVQFKQSVQQLAQYIMQAKQKGLGKVAIKKRLQSLGWKTDEVKKTYTDLDETLTQKERILKKYITIARRKGVADNVIVRRLQESGWSSEIIKKILKRK